MAYLLPISTDPLDSPSHSLLHRIITVDSAAAEQSLKIDSSSNALLLGGVSVDTSFTGKQIATPSNPAASYNKMYFKSGDRLYLLTSGGTESLVGNISGSTGSTDNAILRANGTGTTTVQSTGITIDDSDNIVLPSIVANDQKGIIYRGANRWMHSYYPTNATGNNIFIGTNAGNLTMTADVGEGWEASNLIGIGAGVLSAITQGYLVVAIGSNSYAALTAGSAGTAYGHYSFQRNTSAAGTALGYTAGRYVVGYGNTLVGNAAGLGVDASSTYGYVAAMGLGSGQALTTATGGTFYGSYSGANVTTGSGNIIISYSSTAGSAATTTTGANNIIIGNGSDVSANNASNEMNIGDFVYATGLYGTGKLGIGITNANITARLHLPAGTTSASSAPLKFTSGSLQTTAEAGAMEFLTDTYYLTITTGAVRQQIVTDTNTVTISNKTLTAPRFASGGFIADANGNEIILFTTTASAVNQLTLANAATGSFPIVYSTGDDTNISLGLSSKGTGNINLYSGAAARITLQVADTASSVNYFRITPSVTTANPILAVAGTDTNIGLDFQAKGSGVYRFLATASGPTDIRLFEDTDNGTNYVSLIAPASMASDRVLTLPDATDTLVGKATTDAFTNKTLTNTNNNVAAKSLHSATTVVDVSAATAPSSGQVLTATSSTAATWQTPSGWSLVAQVQLGSDSTTLIDATSISTDYDIFRITLYVQASSGDNPYIRLRLNGDTGTTYYTTSSVTNSTSDYRSNTNAGYIVLSRDASAEATIGTNNSYSAEIIIIKPFANQIARLMGQYSSNSSGSMFTGSFAGQWDDVTNKISQITIGSFVVDANTFLTGSVCIIEGRNIT